LNVISLIVIIGNFAFYGCTGITAIGIQKTAVTYALSIGAETFRNCSSLTKITFIEDGLEIPSLSIGGYAFTSCTKLTDFAGTDTNSIVINSISN
jgi:hypothetical protein